MPDSVVQTFSEGYLLVDLPSCQHSGRSAIVDHELYEHLCKYVSAPLIKSGTDNYWVSAEWGVPPGTVALPDEDTADAPLLLAKDKTLSRLVYSGEETAPEHIA